MVAKTSGFVATAVASAAVIVGSITGSVVLVVVAGRTVVLVLVVDVTCTGSCTSVVEVVDVDVVVELVVVGGTVVVVVGGGVEVVVVDVEVVVGGSVVVVVVDVVVVVVDVVEVVVVVGSSVVVVDSAVVDVVLAGSPLKLNSYRSFQPGLPRQTLGSQQHVPARRRYRPGCTATEMYDCKPKWSSTLTIKVPCSSYNHS